MAADVLAAQGAMASAMLLAKLNRVNFNPLTLYTIQNILVK